MLLIDGYFILNILMLVFFSSCLYTAKNSIISTAIDNRALLYGAALGVVAKATRLISHFVSIDMFGIELLNHWIDLVCSIFAFALLSYHLLKANR